MEVNGGDMPKIGFLIILIVFSPMLSAVKECPVDENKTNFDNQNLAKKDFSVCDFKGKKVSFKKANLAGAIFAKMENGTCSDDFDIGPDLSGANFSGANLEGANLACGLNLSGADFSNANMRNVKADYSSFNGAKFDKKTDLTGANLSNTDLTGISDTEETVFTNVTLDNAVLAGALVNYNTFFKQCSMFGTNMSGMMGDGVLFKNVHMNMTNMGGAQIDGLRILRSIAIHSFFQDLVGYKKPKGAIMPDTRKNKPSFKYTNFSGSLFDNSKLSHVNFSNTVLDNAQFGGATVSTNTKYWAYTNSAQFANFKKAKCEIGGKEIKGFRCIPATGEIFMSMIATGNNKRSL